MATLLSGRKALGVAYSAVATAVVSRGRREEERRQEERLYRRLQESSMTNRV
jgi:hypothetical protein